LNSRWALPKGYRKAAGKCPKAIGQPLGILKGYRKAAGKCPNTCNQPIGEEAAFPSGYWQKCGNFHPFSLKDRISVHIYEKSKESLKICKMLSGSFPIFVLSNHTTFARLKLVRQSL
jgi:hypothetical protein